MASDKVLVVVEMTREEADAYVNREDNCFLNDFSEENRLAAVANTSTTKIETAIRRALARGEGRVWRGTLWVPQSHTLASFDGKRVLVVEEE